MFPQGGLAKKKAPAPGGRGLRPKSFVQFPTDLTSIPIIGTCSRFLFWFSLISERLYSLPYKKR